MSMQDGIGNTVASTLSGANRAGLMRADVYSEATAAEARRLKVLSIQEVTTCDGCLELSIARWAVVPTGGLQ